MTIKTAIVISSIAFALNVMPYEARAITLHTEANNLVLTGKILEADAKKFKEILEGYDGNTLIITSPGGDVEAAIEIGNMILDRKLNVIVRKYCLSSCANYLFPAGAQKTVELESYVVWHGTPTQGLEIRGIPYDEKYVALAKRADAFFERVGLRSDFAARRPPGALNTRDESSGLSAAPYAGWSISPKKLQEKYNMKGIQSFWYPSVEQETKIEQKFLSRYRIYFDR